MSNIIGGIDGNHLRTIVERVERLEEEKRAVSEDISEVYKEAKSLGFDAKIIRQLVKIRKMDQNERYEQETLIDVYKRALGMLPELDEEVEQLVVNDAINVSSAPKNDDAVQ